ncbi:hypothetical protein EVAR_59186_1 [Eumeta japonica]|uniref:Histone-lysine N-methyltransferase SETMAR n=1 Tax=Eumeta variegata TaxID=151549 RepID=A0A4C1ZHI2_EUMVA|nr:hypothetical protein EVAR_59186_1 [Eumeta japonica]
MQRFAGGESNAVNDIVTGIEMLAHPPYSTNLAPGNFYLFLKIKEKLEKTRLRMPRKQWLHMKKVVEATPKCEWAKCFSGRFHRMQ